MPLPTFTDDGGDGLAMFHGGFYVGRVYRTGRARPWAARTARQFVMHDPPLCTDHRTRRGAIGALVDALAADVHAVPTSRSGRRED